MASHVRPNAVFLGIPAHLSAAYPLDLRNRIEMDVNVLGPDIPGSDWVSHEDRLAQVEVIMTTWGMPVLGHDFLAAAPNLKAIFYAAGSVKCFATEEAYERGILIFSARMANAIPVAEYAAATIVLSLKKFWAYSWQAKTNQHWNKTIPVAGINRSTVGLVSLGATGRLTAERLCRLDCNLIAFDPLVSQEQVNELGVSLVSLEEVFRHSDVVSIHSPLLPETKGMIGESLLNLMKPGATLINTARGAVVVQKDLCEVLEQRPDLTAVLDVVDPEPPVPNSPLFTLPNVVLTPHISGSLGNEVGMLGQSMADELRQYLSDLPLSHLVKRELLSQIA